MCAAVVGVGTALSLPGAARAQSDSFEVSVGDRLGSVTTLVAGRPVSLVASVFFLHADPGCTAKDLTGLTATVALAPPVALVNGAQASEQVTLPPGAGPHSNPLVINATWPVRIAQRGSYPGHVGISGRGAGGRTCTGSQDFRIFAVPGQLRFRVGGAVLYPDHVLIAVQARILGSGRLPASVIEDAVSQHHDPRGENFGKSELNLLTASFGARRLTIFAASGFSGGSTGVSCVDFQRPRGVREGAILNYRLRFNWNRDKGFSPTSQRGHLAITKTTRNPIERRCLRQEQLSNGHRPVGRR